MGRSFRAVAIFVVLAYALAWLVALPLWLGEGLAHPQFGLIAMAMMCTPAIAAVIVVCFVERPERRLRALGIWPLGRAGRFVGYLALGLVVPVALVLVALPIGAWLGVYPADFANLSGFAELLRSQGAPDLGVPLQVVVALQLVSIPIGAFVNLIPALGEELGWRGWLLPKLMPLGPVGAIVVSGVIWGVWHAPVVLLGYNYPTAPGWLGVAMMTGMCIVLGGIFGWLRLRSDSVWPAALAHGALNAAAGSFLLFSRAGQEVDTVHATILGWSGWIVPALLLAVIVATGRFRLRPQPAADAAAPTAPHPAGPGQARPASVRSGLEHRAPERTPAGHPAAERTPGQPGAERTPADQPAAGRPAPGHSQQS